MNVTHLASKGTVLGTVVLSLLAVPSHATPTVPLPKPDLMGLQGRLVTALKQGTVQALIAQSPFVIGTNAVDQAYKALTGKPTTPKIGTKFTIITQANEASPQSQAAIYKTSC